MGVFSKYHRFREAGEEANVNNVAEFGQPARSLFTSSKVLSLHKATDITDEQENIVYQSRTKFPPCTTRLTSLTAPATRSPTSSGKS